jgi:hypothetical protein
MSNNRVFYACQAVAICKMGHVPSGGASANVAFIKGVQSVGISTNFSLDQAFELGQVEIYQNSEEVADLEVTLEKVIDGEKLMYLSAAGNTGKTDVTGAADSRSDVYLAIYNDAVDAVAATRPRHVIMCSGMYISSVSYNWSADGNATESLTLVGNDKFFDTSGAGVVLSPSGAWGNSTDTGLSGTDTPASGLIRRTDIDLTNSTLPAEAVSQGSASSRHINSINVSADFGRDQIMELGRFGPYYRYATFPFEISSEFEVTATQTDEVAISGTHPNLVDRTIKIQDNAGTVVDLGTKNKLSSVSYSGGDTGGGNVTITYSYSTFNVFTVQGGGTYW